MENIKKKRTIITIFLMAILFIMILGICIYKKNKVLDRDMMSVERLAELEIQNETIQTSSDINQTISPNATITEKIYYTLCDHLVKNTNDVSEKLVNKTEDEIKKEYIGWKIEKYSPKEIVLYKEIRGMCDEHFVIKEHNGLIGIYKEDSQGMIKLEEDTEISTKYLPEEDIERLKVGIKVIGRNRLIAILKDYE